LPSARVSGGEVTGSMAARQSCWYMIATNYKAVCKHTWSFNKTAFLLPKSRTIYDLPYDVTSTELKRTKRNPEAEKERKRR
jgi:hypothetical protein